MQKKIVAAICAAALALAMPVAALADQVAINSQGTSATMDVKGTNVTLKNVQVTKASDVFSVMVKDNGAVVPSASNAIPNSGESFTVTAQNAKGNAIEGLGRGSVMTADVEFAKGIVNALPDTIASENLYVAGTYKSELQNATVQMPAVKLATTYASGAGSAVLSATANQIKLENLGTGTLTIWMQNGAITRDGASDAAKVADEAKDGSKSPKTGQEL